MADSESGLEIRDRMWLKITIPNAFIGKSRSRSPAVPELQSGTLTWGGPPPASLCSTQAQRWWTGSTGMLKASLTVEKLANTPGTS